MRQPSEARARRAPLRRLLSLLVLVSALVPALAACSGPAADEQSGTQADGGPDRAVPQTGTAAAWFYLADDRDYASIPEAWDDVPFDTVDLLLVGPAGVQADGSFGLFESAETGSLSRRLDWLVARARAENPEIRIVLSQWWGDGAGIWGASLDALGDEVAFDAYATSAAEFVERSRTEQGGRLAIDGIDIDYEGENVVPGIDPVSERLREALDGVAARTGSPALLAVSPAETEHLSSEVLERFDLVHMQSYAGGGWIPVSFYLDLGIAPERILAGICPETDCPTPSEAEVLGAVEKYGLGGVHVWRLNSDNSPVEVAVQRRIAESLHS